MFETGSDCHVSVQRRPPSVENVPAMANAIPGLREKCSASRRNRRSPSARKIVRIQPGIVFGFIPEWRSACPGFPTTLKAKAKELGYELVQTP